MKAIALELCCQFTGESQREIGGYFGYTSGSSVGKQKKVLALGLKTDHGMERRYLKLKQELASV